MNWGLGYQKVGFHAAVTGLLTRRRESNGNQILKMGLLEAGKIGLNNLLITCDEANIGSVRIIEKNKGKLRSSFIDEDTGERVLQYIIEL
ncbi:hypothetical protein [Psychrilyobacter sp.]|uniref:hypothetical protein n=1 Tax=Psychrilyobacter sp. TaxID=2586924 RepID=UPI003015B182